jgi:hypothetical protein
MIILAVDPGLVSGVALWDSQNIEKMLSDEIPYQNIGTWLEDAVLAELTLHHTVHLACERYTMTTGVKTAQPEALKTMGIAEHLSVKHDVRLHYYLPDTCKKMISNARLKEKGWYRKTKDGHANDAARVLGTCLFSNFPDIAGRLFGL